MIAHYLVPATYGLGLMAICGISYGVLQRTLKSSFIQSFCVGLVFSVVAVLAMHLPIALQDGVILDARAVIVGLAAAFGGLPAAIVSGLLVGGYRWHIGGLGAVAGTCGILACVILGYLWHRSPARHTALTTIKLAELGIVLSLHTISIFLLPMEVVIDLFSVAVPTLVASCVVGAVMMGSLIERERRYLRTERHWQHHASTDSLTGLPNRRAFVSILSNIVIPPAPFHSSVLMIVDADHFKLVNDTYGHEAGDEALKQLADNLRTTALPDEHI